MDAKPYLTQPFPALSTVYRLKRRQPELEIDLTSQIHGAKSFNSLRSRATRIQLDHRSVLVAALADIIKSKREANRPRDVAVLHVLEKTLKEAGSKAPQPGRSPGDHA